MKKDSLYLYGVKSLKKFKYDPYKDVLETKIGLAKVLLNELLEEHYLKRDFHRIEAIQKAIDFNKMLLDELN